MDNQQQPPHILLVVYPIQSHMNPAIQFATHVLRSGALVTLATTVSGAKRMKTSGGTAPAGLSFATFSDGYDDDSFRSSKDKVDPDTYVSSLRRHGSEGLSELIAASPGYTCVVYTVFIAWAAEVARRHHLPSVLLWNQNAAVFSIYYHYYNGYSDVIDKCDENDPAWCVELPSLPLLRGKDIPSFLAPSNTYAFGEIGFKEHFEVLNREENPIILVNTFDALEGKFLQSIYPRFRISAVGPLLPPSYLQEEEENNRASNKTCCFSVDLFKRSEVDYVAWLDAKPDSSVVYISFGSLAVLSTAQMEELAGALLDSGRPFLWVVRQPEEGGGEEEKPPRWAEVEERGMVVTWCSQVEVLSHRAVGCFVTHCGWNSTLESLAAGVPVVAVPGWTDQLTNAKMAEDVWKTGMRVRTEEREEMRRCVEAVMESEEMRRNAMKWRELAAEAARAGGSSEVNLRAFVEVLWRMSGRRVANKEDL